MPCEICRLRWHKGYYIQIKTRYSKWEKQEQKMLAGGRSCSARIWFVFSCGRRWKSSAELERVEKKKLSVGESHEVTQVGTSPTSHIETDGLAGEEVSQVPGIGTKKIVRTRTDSLQEPDKTRTRQE